jgi:hypothetical protein
MITIEWISLALAVIAMISFAAWLNRDNLFRGKQRSMIGYAQNPQPTTPPQQPVAAQQPQQQRATAAQQSTVVQPSGPVWKFFKSVLGFALVVGLVVWIGFSVYQHFSSTTPSSIISRTSTTNLSHGVPAEIALPIIADCESGNGTPGSGKQFGLDGKLVRNPKNLGAVGKWQINLSDPAIVKLVKEKGWKVEENEVQNEEAAKFLYQEYQTTPWTESAGCWEPKLRAYTWGGGEAVAIVVKAPVDKLSDIIVLPRNGGNHSLDGFGKKYTVRWNNGRQDEIEEDLPRLPNAEKKKPLVVYDFRLKSRESEATPITVKFF